MGTSPATRRSKASDSASRRQARVRPGDRSGAARKLSRTCVGCRAAGSKDDLVRCVLAPEGRLVVDLRGGSFGRGGWVHPSPACLRKAVPAGFSRSFKAPLVTSAAELAQELRSAADQRVASLLGSARRARALAIGADAVAEALAEGRAALVVVAADARAAAETRGVSEAVARGQAVVWGTKSKFGKVVGRTELGVAAVLDNGLATATKRAVALAQMPATDADDVGQGAFMEAR